MLLLRDGTIMFITSIGEKMEGRSSTLAQPQGTFLTFTLTSNYRTDSELQKFQGIATSPQPQFASCPLASREPLDQLVSKILDRSFEVMVVVRFPIRRSTRDSFITGESDIENIGLVMTVVTRDAISIAGRS